VWSGSAPDPGAPLLRAGLTRRKILGILAKSAAHGSIDECLVGFGRLDAQGAVERGIEVDGGVTPVMAPALLGGSGTRRGLRRAPAASRRSGAGFRGGLMRVPASSGSVRSLSTCLRLLALAASASCTRAEPPAQAPDLLASVRPFITADTALQALRPPADANVWYQVTPDGNLVATGRDTSRVALMLHARSPGRGRVTS
jgi:hypothetical protein